jgi:alpha-tubulin suppressor-like RCC1 family protein
MGTTFAPVDAQLTSANPRSFTIQPGTDSQVGFLFGIPGMGQLDLSIGVVDGDNAVGVNAIAAGGSHTCARIGKGRVRCWGDGLAGELGYGNANSLGDNETAASAGDVNVGGLVMQIAAGSGHTCAVLQSGRVRCWGAASAGRLGYGNTTNVGDTGPPALAGDVVIGAPVSQVATGGAHTCALLASGNVRCWGSNESGQLGYGGTNQVGDTETPASAGDVDVGGSVVQIAAGVLHTCALLASGSVRCWGAGFSGQLGYGSSTNVGDKRTPASAGDVDVGGPVTQIATGASHTCALLASGAVRCWGFGGSGQLGYGNIANVGDHRTPASAGDVAVGAPVVRIVAGGDHTCALLASGGVRCWGAGFLGQLGYGNASDVGDHNSPASAGDVSVGGRAVDVAAGSAHTCALLDSGIVRCWGNGTFGQLGYGNKNSVGLTNTPSSVDGVPVL